MLKTSQNQLAKNSLLLINVAEDVKVGVTGGNREDKIDEKSLHSKNSNRVISYLTPNAKLAFTQLRQAFTKAPISQHFDPKYYIRIETDASDYAIGTVLNQLILNNLGQWHQIAYYLQKMIPAKTCYETYNDELLAIVKAFKT